MVLSYQKWIVAIVVALMGCGVAMAGTVLGTGGSTEVTQIANNIQLVQQYEQMVAGYVRQGLQLQNELKNLVQNPASLLGKDIGGIINGVGKIYSGGKAIGGSLAQIDKNFASTFKSPTAETLSKSFTRWQSTNTDTLEAALKAAGMHRDQFESDNAALSALYDESQNTQGNLDSLQTLAKFNAAQIQQLQGLKDLIASQNIAASTYMATQNAKEIKSQADYEQLARPYDQPIPTVEKGTVIKWKNVLFNK
ncbi:MAG: conjugal transfer protein TrbJ [Pseudomonadota bacterium]